MKMKAIGLALLVISNLAMIGSIIWVIATEPEAIPAIIYVIIGTSTLGFLMLIGVAIRDRVRQKKDENFERRDN